MVKVTQTFSLKIKISINIKISIRASQLISFLVLLTLMVCRQLNINPEVITDPFKNSCKSYNLRKIYSKCGCAFLFRQPV